MAFAGEAVPKWNEEIKAKYGRAGTKYACVGYCMSRVRPGTRKGTLIEIREGFGAPYVCDSLSKDGTCTAGAFAHPAFLKESHFSNLESESF